MLNKKKFLIFTGAGDTHQGEFLSWCSAESALYDRAVNFYGDDETVYRNIKELNPEYLFKSKGDIWNNFVKQYSLFQLYSYVLIVDSDLYLNRGELEDTFLIATSNNWSACQWSRNPESFGLFVPLYKQSGDRLHRVTNFIEMCFMLIRIDLLDLFVKKYKGLDLEWADGIDLVLSNVALNNKLLPFYIIDKYSFYNPYPREKVNGRELDFETKSTFETRFEKLKKIMESDKKYFRINMIVECDGVKLSRDCGWSF